MEVLLSTGLPRLVYDEKQITWYFGRYLQSHIHTYGHGDFMTNPARGPSRWKLPHQALEITATGLKKNMAPFPYVFYVQAHKHILRERKSTGFNEFVFSV